MFSFRFLPFFFSRFLPFVPFLSVLSVFFRFFRFFFCFFPFFPFLLFFFGFRFFPFFSVFSVFPFSSVFPFLSVFSVFFLFSVFFFFIPFHFQKKRGDTIRAARPNLRNPDSNTELSELFGPQQVSGRELSEFFLAYYLCSKTKSPTFSQNSLSLAQNSVSSLFRDSALKTVFPPFPITPRYFLSKQYSPRFLSRKLPVSRPLYFMEGNLQNGRSHLHGERSRTAQHPLRNFPKNLFGLILTYKG